MRHSSSSALIHSTCGILVSACLVACGAPDDDTSGQVAPVEPLVSVDLGEGESLRVAVLEDGDTITSGTANSQERARELAALTGAQIYRDYVGDDVPEALLEDERRIAAAQTSEGDAAEVVEKRNIDETLSFFRDVFTYDATVEHTASKCDASDSYKKEVYHHHLMSLVSCDGDCDYTHYVQRRDIKVGKNSWNTVMDPAHCSWDNCWSWFAYNPTNRREVKAVVTDVDDCYHHVAGHGYY